MTDHKESTARPPEPLELDAGLTCSECGAFGAFPFDGVNLCPSCYTEKGSCCPEFGKDDLWRKHESSGSPNEGGGNPRTTCSRIT